MALVQIVVWMLACASLSASPYKSKTINLDPTYSAKTNQTCTRNGYSGICVPENYCNVDHIIETGGIIEDSDLRAKSECKEGDWCCALENTVTDVLTTQPPKTPETRHGGDECVATKIDKCPWCVSLYKIKGQNSELFCGGVLIGPKVVLTTATCNLVSKKATVVARVPGSPESKKNYKVISRSPHPHYNSGTREYDLALLLLEEEVGWNNNRINNGACLALRTPLKDGCYAFGYNANDEIESTILITKSGSCNTGGQGADAACGTSLDGDPCIVATGLPVICPSDTKDLLVTGIVRSPCANSSAQLGSLQQSSTWLIKELTQLGLGKNKMKVCEVNNRAGKCVEKSYCQDSEFTFSNVIEGHSTGCGAFEECCEEDKVIIPPPNTPVNEGCVIREDTSCPWCVSLFKWPSPEHDITLFCAGVLLGSKVILTTMTCYMEAVSDHNVIWATVPASIDPQQQYYVQFKKPNHEYNNETHEHDVALFILKDEVKWANNRSNGACLDFNLPMTEANCASFGFKDDQNIHTTDLSISKSCYAGSVPATSYCGNPYMDAPCIVSTGAPVVCRDRTINKWVVAGIARRPCLWIPEVGSLASSSSWLREELKNIGLDKLNYMHFH